MGYPSASLTSRSAPARYAQEGSCPSYAHCQGVWPVLLWVLILASLVLLGVGTWAAWRSWKALRGEPASLEEQGTGRARFMALFGLMESALFALVILATSISTFILDPCD